jgi:hypothetical protein
MAQLAFIGYRCGTHDIGCQSGFVLPLLYALHTGASNVVDVDTRTRHIEQCGGKQYSGEVCTGLPKHCLVEIIEIDTLNDPEGTYAHLLQFQTTLQCTELSGATGSWERLYGERPPEASFWEPCYPIIVATAAGVPIAILSYSDNNDTRDTWVHFICSATASRGGSILMQYIMDQADIKDYTVSLFDVSTVKGGTNFYERLGFLKDTSDKRSELKKVRPRKSATKQQVTI